jgi:hypothetical protein
VVWKPRFRRRQPRTGRNFEQTLKDRLFLLVRKPWRGRRRPSVGQSGKAESLKETNPSAALWSTAQFPSRIPV